MSAIKSNRVNGNVWCIVLAAGDGSRLQELATGPSRLLDGGSTLIHHAITRAAMLTSGERVVPVVSADHRGWWELELASLPRRNIIVQPSNRGTACGLLLPLMHILFRDPQAVVVAIPSDHVVEDERTLARAARQAIEVARRDGDSAVLLGFQPDAPHGDLGWVTPSVTSSHGTRAVLSFHEKPSEETARRLMEGGGLLNSLIVVARGLGLLAMYERAFPGLVDRFAAAVVGLLSESGRHGRVRRLYQDLATLDLSRDLLEPYARDLRVVPVPPCGWCDIGTPERLVRWMHGRGPTRPQRAVKSGQSSPPDLVGLARSYLGRGRTPSAAHSL